MRPSQPTDSGRSQPPPEHSSPEADGPAPRLIAAPEDGIWRVARAHDPYNPSVLAAEDADLLSGGNRFDAVDHGTLYFATNLEGCFAETTARYRLSAKVLAAIQEDEEWAERGFMQPGTVPADWRSRRLATRAVVDQDALFLDVDAPATHSFITRHMAVELSKLGVDVLDVGLVRGRDRRITRAIANFAYEFRADDASMLAGLRYASRLGPWECWAVFDRTQFVERERRTISASMPELVAIAKTYDLTVL